MDLFITNMQLSVNKTLIDGLELYELLVGYRDVFISWVQPQMFIFGWSFSLSKLTTAATSFLCAI